MKQHGKQGARGLSSAALLSLSPLLAGSLEANLSARLCLCVVCLCLLPLEVA